MNTITLWMDRLTNATHRIYPFSSRDKRYNSTTARPHSGQWMIIQFMLLALVCKIIGIWRNENDLRPIVYCHIRSLLSIAVTIIVCVVCVVCCGPIGAS